MSLLVFCSGSRISQGLISHLYKSQQFQKIVCADLYPSYQIIEDYCRLRDQLKAEGSGNKTDLTDIKISERSDLQAAIQKSSHILYVSHDYYSLTSSKVNLLKTTASLVKQAGGNKKLIATLPIEYDHQGEMDPLGAVARSENEAFEAYNNIVLLKSDLIFGKYAGILNRVIHRVINGEGVKFRPSQEKVHPIHSDDLAFLVSSLLTGSITGRSFLAKGKKGYTLNQIFDILESSLDQNIERNGKLYERILTPLNNNLISEALYTPEYRNLVQFFKDYKPPTISNTGYLSDLGLLEFKSLEETYQPKSINKSEYENKDNSAISLAKSLFY